MSENPAVLGSAISLFNFCSSNIFKKMAWTEIIWEFESCTLA